MKKMFNLKTLLAVATISMSSFAFAGLDTETDENVHRYGSWKHFRYVECNISEDGRGGGNFTGELGKP